MWVALAPVRSGAATTIRLPSTAALSFLDEQLLRPEQFVFDIVYTPLRTRLLTEAELVGCRTIPGVEMFLHQAAFQFELWTGVEAPVGCMRKVVMESLA